MQSGEMRRGHGGGRIILGDGRAYRHRIGDDGNARVYGTGAPRPATFAPLCFRRRSDAHSLHHRPLRLFHHRGQSIPSIHPYTMSDAEENYQEASEDFIEVRLAAQQVGLVSRC